MEIGDTADQRRAGDEVVGVHEQLGHEIDVANVALHEGVARVVVVGPGNRPVLRVVVDADDLMPAPEQLLHEITADETGGTADDDLAHVVDSCAEGAVIFGPNAWKYQWK